jgi:hypothetical protein
MPVREIRDRFYAEWKRYQGDYDAFMAESAKGLRHIVCGEDITAAIGEEKTEAGRIFRVRSEHFDKLAAAD